MIVKWWFLQEVSGWVVLCYLNGDQEFDKIECHVEHLDHGSCSLLLDFYVYYELDEALVASGQKLAVQVVWMDGLE